jgi:rhomboid protease GluP
VPAVRVGGQPDWEGTVSSLIDTNTPAALAGGRDALKDNPGGAQAAPEDREGPVLQRTFSFDERLRSVTPHIPVTLALAAVNVAMFAAMAVAHRKLFYFNPHVLLTWGGGLAPRVFGHEWWRAGSHMFVHGDLAHLAGNLLFLLLIAPTVERLLGPARSAVVYLFAGVGGGLLVMGTFPPAVAVGASAAVFGLYGALLGCCLRGPRSIPWRVLARRGGLLLLYAVVSMASQWLDFAEQPVAHLGGFVFGLAGGLLCGHRLQPSSARRGARHLAGLATVCVAILGLTAWGVHRCAAEALTCYSLFAKVKDRERELLGRFHDAVLQWKQKKMTSTEWKRLLESKLIPELQEMRAAHHLTLTGQLAGLERHDFSMQEFWNELRTLRGKLEPHDDRPLTAEEGLNLRRIICKVRLDTWRSLAKDLPGNHAFIRRSLLDDEEIDLLSAALDDDANQTNPLFRCFELSRSRSRLDD